MIQLTVLTGKAAGLNKAIDRFPCRIGRAPGVELYLEEAGVWDNHLEIRFSPSDGFILKTLPNAFVHVNGAISEETALRNGDVIDIGAAKVQFWLRPARQKDLRARELVTWILLGLMPALQIALIYWLRQ